MFRQSIVVKRCTQMEIDRGITQRFRFTDAQRSLLMSVEIKQDVTVCLTRLTWCSNFGIVICVYNWDVSCGDSVYRRYRPFIRIACTGCIGNQPLFLGISLLNSALYQIFNIELIYRNNITYLNLRFRIIEQTEVNRNTISVSHKCFIFNRTNCKIGSNLSC